MKLSDTERRVLEYLAARPTHGTYPEIGQALGLTKLHVAQATYQLRRMGLIGFMVYTTPVTDEARTLLAKPAAAAGHG